MPFLTQKFFSHHRSSSCSCSAQNAKSVKRKPSCLGRGIYRRSVLHPPLAGFKPILTGTREHLVRPQKDKGRDYHIGKKHPKHPGHCVLCSSDNVPRPRGLRSRNAVRQSHRTCCYHLGILQSYLIRNNRYLCSSTMV